jgi:hypothetical protein
MIIVIICHTIEGIPERNMVLGELLLAIFLRYKFMTRDERKIIENPFLNEKS